MEQTKKYFLYSATEAKIRSEVEAKMGRKFHVGIVIVNGLKKPFTEISSTVKIGYSDRKNIESRE